MLLFVGVIVQGMEKPELLEVNPSVLLTWHEKVRLPSLPSLLRLRRDVWFADSSLAFVLRSFVRTANRSRRSRMYREGYD